VDRKVPTVLVDKWHLVHRATQGHRNTCTDKQLFVKVLCTMLMALNMTFKSSLHSKLTLLKS